MTDLDLISIGAKHSTPGQFSREFTEEQWISAGRAIESAATKPLLERIAEMEAKLARQGAQKMASPVHRATMACVECGGVLGHTRMCSKFPGYCGEADQAPNAQQAEPMCRIAKLKLAELIANGYRECGVMIEFNHQDGKVTRGAVSNGGMVIWWHPESMEAAHERAQQAEPAKAMTDAAGDAFNNMFHKCRAEVSMDWWQRIWKMGAEWAQQAEAREPLFWYRPCGDGLYEGPHHNNAVLGRMLREEKPGAWKPLFTRPQPAQLQRLGQDEWASVFRDASSAFFSDGCKNLTEQANACAHAAMRATESALAAKNGAKLK